MTKTWFITGASSGLGLVMTEKLLDRGDRVIGSARRMGALSELANAHGDRLSVVAFDLIDTVAMRAAVARAFESVDRIDVVVSNAGYGLFGAAEELSDRQIGRQLATNLTASLQLIRASLPHLRSQGGGRIMQVSSEGGQVAYPNFSLYHASKWGIEGFVESVSQEVAPFGIEIALIEPGPARTAFGSGIVNAAPMEVYATTPAGQIRAGIAAGSFEIIGDPAKMAQAIIDCTDRATLPKRLALGSSSYAAIGAVLHGRLAELEANKAVTLSTDIDA